MGIRQGGRTFHEAPQIGLRPATFCAQVADLAKEVPALLEEFSQFRVEVRPSPFLLLTSCSVRIGSPSGGTSVVFHLLEHSFGRQSLRVQLSRPDSCNCSLRSVRTTSSRSRSCFCPIRSVNGRSHISETFHCVIQLSLRSSFL